MELSGRSILAIYPKNIAKRCGDDQWGEIKKQQNHDNVCVKIRHTEDISMWPLTKRTHKRNNKTKDKKRRQVPGNNFSFLQSTISCFPKIVFLEF